MNEGPVLTFADDESPGADVAWLWLTSHDWDGWRVQVLHADSRVVVRPGAGGAVATHPWQTSHPRRLATAGGWIEPEHIEAEGDPRVVLTCCDADLIVVGARGRGILKAMHIGSTAEWLMSCPPTPIVIARSGRPTRRMLVCTDGSPDARFAAQVAAGLPWIRDVEVTVLGVPELDYDPVGEVASVVAMFEDAGASVRAEVRRPDELQVFYSVRDIALDLAREIDADLIVLGSRGLSEWQSLRAGSVSTSLARLAPCSVLIAHHSPDSPGA